MVFSRITSGLVVLGLAAGAVALENTPVAASTLVSTVYSYTGSTQTFTVPAGVTSLTVTLQGGQGGQGGLDYGSRLSGGYQGVVTGVVAVTPGAVITVAVGGGGGIGAGGGSAPGGSAGQNPLAGYDGAVGGISGPNGSSGGGGGSGAASVLQIGGTDIVAGGAGGNGGNGQYVSLIGRRAEETHTPRPDATSTTGRPGWNTTLACGGACDGGASGAGGGGLQGGERGTIQYGGATATEWFGFGGFPGANSTAGLAGLGASYNYYAANSANGSITIAYDDGAPGAPLNLSGTAKTGAVDLSWNAPSFSGSSAITDYRVEMATNLAGPFTIFADGVSTALVAEVTGLTNGTTYFFRVSAINSEGVGAAATTTVGIVPSDVPSPPTVTGLVPFGAGIHIDFTPGASDSPITGYEYRLDGGAWTSGTATSNRLTISGLTNGRSYSVELRARNIIGASTPSTPAQSATPRDVAQAPTGLLPVAGDAIVALTWTAPTVDNGASVTDYAVQTATSVGGPYTAFAHAASISTSSTITGLSNGTTYYLRVAAVNSVGAGAWSTTAIATPYTSPNAPSIALTPGDGALTVAITPGFNGGSAVTGYEYRLGAGGSWISTGALGATFTIAGLANATAYDVYVRAINAAGPSPASTVQTSTPRTVPAAPAIATVALDTGAINVSFTVGSDGGSPLTNVQYSVDAGSNWVTRSPASTVSPLSISGLVGGQTYPVRLRVVNAAGFSAASNSSLVTAKGTPEAPVISLGGADRALVVTFTTPANGGTTITNYEYSVDGGTTWSPRSPSATSSPLVLGGLANGTEYSVRLRAVNAVGSGASSSTVLGVPRTTPGAPSIAGTTIGGSDGALDVVFTVGSDGGSPIITYQYSTDGGASWRDRQSGTVASPLHITTASSDGSTPLVGGQTYPVEIRAVNAAGPGTASAVADGITTTVPAAPVIVTVDSRDASASVSFTTPANGGSAITRFEYRLDSGTWTDTGSLAAEFVISGLANSTTYSLQMRAVNGVGAGPASAARLVQVFTTPAAPTLSAIVPGDRTLSVAFTAAGDGGSAITGYQYSTDGGATWRTRGSGTTGSPLVITAESGNGAALLTNGTIYAVQLRAVNAAGSGAATETMLAAPRGAPSAPTAFSVAAADGALVLTFTRGSDGGSPITAVEYQLDGGAWVNPSSLSSPLTVAGLANGQSYSVAVRTRNAVGPGSASASQSGTPRTIPGAPTNVLVSSASHQVTVSWDSPASNGGANISGYTVSVFGQISGGTAIATCTTTVTRTCTVSGLTDGTTVYVDVVAENEAGTGPASAPRLARTPLAAPQVTIASISPAANQLAVNVNVVDAGGSPITAFEYQLDAGTWQPAQTATSPFTISDLTTGLQYSIRVRAINAAGTGDPSPAVLAVPHTTPSAPTSLSATGAPASAVLSWTAPASNGGQPVTDYVVQYGTNSAGPFTTFAHGPSSATTATVTGLTNATAYVFRVGAVNTAGTGSWSTLASATPRSAPSAPTISSITPGSHFLQVAFTVPSSDGGSAVTGYEYQLDGGTWQAASGTSSPLAINGLTNGHTYSVQIRAVNAVGAGTASVAVTQKPYGLPAAVVGFRASPSTTSVTLSWDVVNDNGSAITAYNVIRWSALSAGSISASFQTTSTSQTFTGLGNGTYYFTVEATNAAGTGPRSAPRTTAIVGGTVPSAPSAPSASVTDAHATMAWTAGAAGTSAITSYLVQYSTDELTWVTMSSGSSATSAAFDVPTSSTPYALRVAAISDAGVGAFVTIHPPIAVTGSVSDVQPSGATIAGTVNANGGTVSVAFQLALTPSELGTGTSTTIAATPASASGSADTAVSAALPGLLPGTSYAVRTVATVGAVVVIGTTRTFTTNATITSSGLNPVYTGSPAVMSTVTQPVGITLVRSFAGIDRTVYATSATPPTAVGTYRVTTTSTNIGGAEVVTLTIVPKPVTITVSAADRLYNGTTSATLTLGLVGIIDGDAVGVDASKLSGAFGDAGVGVDKIVSITTQAGLLTGLKAANYEPSVPTEITATIVRAPQTLSFTSAVSSPATVGTTYVPVVASSASLTPTLAIGSGAGESCSMSSGTVTLLSAGECVLVATQTGTVNFAGATVQQTITIVAAPPPSPVLPELTVGGYTPLTATRILDTRQAGERIAAATEYRLAVPAALVPTDVSALVLNLTVTEATGNGYVTVYQCGSARPLAVAVNFTAGETKANLVDAMFRADSGLCLWSNVATHLIVDLQGFHSPSGIGRLVPRTAVRVADTRPDDPLVAGQILQIPVIGDGKAPAGTIAVALNVAVDDPQRAGYLTVYPCGADRPLASNLNFVAGQTVSNEVMVQPGADGMVCVYTTAATQLVADLDATYDAGGSEQFTAQVPGRLADTRVTTKVLAGQSVEWIVVGNGSAPAGTTALALNVAVTEPEGAGYLTVYPCGSKPLASNLNFAAGQTVSNHVTTAVSNDGRICVFASRTTNVVIDVEGTYGRS